MQVKEIESQIKQINWQMSILSGKKADLRHQLTEAKQIEFEEKHGIKQGDKLRTIDGKYYYYDRIILSIFDTMYVVCHPAKNDGIPGKKTCQLFEDDLIFKY